jgi:hypothetical protein
VDWGFGGLGKLGPESRQQSAGAVRDGPEQTTGGEDGGGGGGASEGRRGPAEQSIHHTGRRTPDVVFGRAHFPSSSFFPFSFSFFVLFQICDGGGGIDWRLKEAG